MLALLFAERDLLAAERRRPPLMLLDDVMSELDGARRERLAELLRGGGQAVLTATDRAHVPLSEADGARFVEVAAGEVRARTRPPAPAERWRHEPTNAHRAHSPPPWAR